MNYFSSSRSNSLLLSESSFSKTYSISDLAVSEN